MRESKTYYVWDAPTRCFHWINAVSVFALLASGLFLRYREAFYIDDIPAKMALTAAHVVFLHISGVALSEVVQQSGLVSSMISGKRTFQDPN